MLAAASYGNRMHALMNSRSDKSIGTFESQLRLALHEVERDFGIPGNLIREAWLKETAIEKHASAYRGNGCSSFDR